MFDQILKSLGALGYAGWRKPEEGGYLPFIGSPEFGVTEAVSDYQNIPRNPYTGGSQALNTSSGVGSFIPQTYDTNRSIPQMQQAIQASQQTSGGGNRGSGGGGGGGTGDGGTNNGPSPFDQAVARARAAYEAAIRDADYNLSRAQGLFDEGMGVLDQRRQEFQNLFNEGRDRILDRYEAERGNLQAAARGAQQRAANVLRAMGITGGSAPINLEGRQRQENMKALGALQTQRDQNETANQRQFDERNLWALTQERALQRSLDDALNARRSLGERAGLIQQGDIDAINREANSFNNILNNVLSGLQGVNSLASNFTANPLSVNIADMSNSIDAITPTMTNTGATGVQNVNLREQDPLFSNLLRRAGGSLYAY